MTQDEFCLYRPPKSGAMEYGRVDQSMTSDEALAKLDETEMKAVKPRANPLSALHEADLTPETFYS